MPTQVRRRIARILGDKRRRDEYLTALAMLAVVVVVAVAAVLTQQGHAATQEVRVLDCPVTGTVAHAHDESCYDGDGNLVCPLPEVEAHVHDDSCYAEERVLVCGLEEGEGHVHTDECYEVVRTLVCGKDEVTETHVHGPGCFRTVDVEVPDEEPAGDGAVPATPGKEAATPAVQDPALAETHPEQNLYHEFKDADGNLVLRVDVKAPEGALPAGSMMVATWVDPESLSQKQQDAVDGAIAKKADGQVLGMQAVDIKFVDALGAEVEPAAPVTVTMTSALVNTDDQPLVVHIDDLTEAQERAQEQAIRDGASAEEAEPARSAEVLGQLSDQALAQRDVAAGDDRLSFESDRFSTYVLAVTSLHKVMQASDGSTVTVTVDAPAEAGIPQGAELRVQEIAQGSADWQGYEAQALGAIGADESELARFFDIAIVGEDGQEIQPAQPVQVEIELADAPKDAEASVVHFGEETEVVPATEDAGVATFDASGFSVYGVVYTVDFHWNVDGQDFEYNLQGGDAVGLRELLPALGAVDADAIDGFVAHIASVEFSDPSLIAVAQVTADTTAGELKKAQGLQPEYSAELSKKDIAAMDAKLLAAPDWALVGLKPFDTEETLTITMTNGEVFTVKVSDGQLHTYVISDSGDTYEVIVTYDESAGIPEDAELVVKELRSDSKEFAKNIDLVNKELASNDESEVSNPVQFDISIVSGDEEVEPKEGSTVKVEIRLAKSMFEEAASAVEDADLEGVLSSKKETGMILFNGQEISLDDVVLTGCRIAHIADDGTAEIIEDVENNMTDDKIVMQFETESFSDYLFDTTSEHSFNNLPSTIYVGDEIYMWDQADYWVTNIGSVVSETKHNNGWDPDGWGQLQPDDDNFKTVTAISTGTFRIYNRYNQGQYKEITVRPARTGTTPPATIDTINNASIGLTLNLFDYDLDNYLDDYFNGSSHYDNTCISDFAGHGINSGNALKFWGSGIGNNYGSLNQYVEHGVTSIVNTNLNSAGYPVLSNNSGGSGNRDLSYLFTPSDGTDKKAYTNVNGLFKKDGDYYVYDSNQNYAYYDVSQGNGGSFQVYNSTYNQKSGGESGTTQNKAIGFFPFHRWDNQYDLYVNWNKNLNHHFGMSMSVPFSLPKHPKAVVDTNGDPIIFEFSGDDDLWVFIDGKLAMDIGGIHQPTSGTINFQTGVVTVNGNRQLTASQFSSRFPDLYDGKQHTLQVFYIERGGCDSNCRIQFNMTLYGDIHFDKVDEDEPSDQLAGAVFGIYKDAGCTTPLMENLKDGTSRAYVARSNATGHVQFSDIPLGTYYLKELHAPAGYPLDNTIHTVEVYYDQSTGQVKIKVEIDDQDVEEGVKITNKKPQPIDLGLLKVWQNEDDETITAPAGAEATFEIKRIRTYETYREQTIEGEGRQVSHLTVGWIHNGETHIHAEYDLVAGTRPTVSWGYKDGYDGTVGYILNGTQYPKTPVSTNVYSQAFNMPAAGGSATFYVIDNSENGEAIRSINVAGQQFYGNSGGGVIHEFTTHTEPDPDFSYTGDHVTGNQVTLPIDPNTWSYDFTELPTFGRGTVVIDGTSYDVAFNYTYYLEEVSNTAPEGTTVVYTDLAGNPINSPTDAETSTSGTQTITNKVPTGYLRIDKAVTYNGISPVPDGKKSDLAGTYTFNVYTDENCSKPYKVIQGEAPNQQATDLELTVTIGEDGAAKSSETVKLPVGDYWIEEQTPSQTGVTPDENRIKVTITADQTTNKPAIASFTNNKEESDNPDELAIELEKTFTGLPNSSKIPANYEAVLTYTYNGSPVIVPLTGSTQGNVTCTKSLDGLTWHWRITQIPKTATGFGVYESNYDITGYTRITKINGSEVQNPGVPQTVSVLVPEITMTNPTSDYTTTDNNKVFTVEDNQILLVRMTNHATVIVSQKSLSYSTRQAIEKKLRDNGGKIPGDDGANAQWVMNFVYFSHEIQGDSFSYGGRTIYFEGNQVKIPHKSSSHEVRVDIAYTSTSAENSFTIENIYTEIPTEVDVLKVEKGNETTTHLPGAVFELRKLEDVAPTPGGTLTYVKENDQVIVTSATTGSNGRLTFSNLTYGVYEIRELTPPPGYIQTEDVTFYLRVDGGVITYVQKGSNKPSEWTAAPNSGGATVYFMGAQEANPDGNPPTEAANATFRVGNTYGAALPNAGGPGTGIFVTVGTSLMIGALLMLVRRRRMA